MSNKIRICYSSDRNPKVRESYSIRTTPEGTRFSMSLKGHLTGGTLERMLHAHDLLHRLNTVESTYEDGMFAQRQQPEPRLEDVLAELKARLGSEEPGHETAVEVQHATKIEPKTFVARKA